MECVHFIWRSHFILIVSRSWNAGASWHERFEAIHVKYSLENLCLKKTKGNWDGSSGIVFTKLAPKLVLRQTYLGNTFIKENLNFVYQVFLNVFNAESNFCIEQYTLKYFSLTEHILENVTLRNSRVS